jgi:cell division protein FtsI/penicillin-binding protein 2
MGSIIKPLVMGMALDQNVVTPATTYYDGGSVQVADRTIYNFDKKARGTVDMKEVLKQSLNTGMVFIMNKMQKSVVKKYVYDLGLGEKTGIDLPYETSGLLRNLDTNRDVEYANAAFGQGIALTPIATVRSLASLANGGKTIRPYLVDAADYHTGLGTSLAPDPETNSVQVFKPETVEKVSNMLVELVDTSFAPRYPQLAAYSIAAKTGTAQIPQPGGGYYNDRNLHSFFGYFPAYDPEFIVFFYLLQPVGARFSSETLSGPFMDTAQFLIDYYDISPDRAKVE